MGETERTQPELVKDAQQVEIGAERLDAFHREEERDLFLLPRRQDFAVAPANREPIGSANLDIEARDLIQGNAQPHFRQITIVDVNRRPGHADVSSFKILKKIRREDIL